MSAVSSRQVSHRDDLAPPLDDAPVPALPPASLSSLDGLDRRRINPADARWTARLKPSGGSYDVLRYGVHVGHMHLSDAGLWVGWRFGTRYEHEDFRICAELTAFGCHPAPEEDEDAE